MAVLSLGRPSWKDFIHETNQIPAAMGSPHRRVTLRKSKKTYDSYGTGWGQPFRLGWAPIWGEPEVPLLRHHPLQSNRLAAHLPAKNACMGALSIMFQYNEAAAAAARKKRTYQEGDALDFLLFILAQCAIYVGCLLRRISVFIHSINIYRKYLNIIVWKGVLSNSDY